MSVKIIDTVGSQELKIDAISNAARVTLYDTLGNTAGQKATYSAGTNDTVTAAATATAPFFVIYGSATKTIRVHRIILSGPLTTTLSAQGVTLRKYSTAPTGGTATALAPFPHDSNSAGSSVSLCQVYTATPTAGTVTGILGTRRFMDKSTTVVDGSAFPEIIFDFRAMGGETSSVVLRGTAQGLGLALHVPTSTTMSLSIEFTEE